MLSDFFARRRMADLIRGAQDSGRPDRSECIAELGKLPPTDESIACLIELSLNHQRDYSAANQAIAALGMLDDRRSTDHLVERIRKNGGRIDDVVAKAYAHPRHARALPEIAGIAREQCWVQDDVFRAGQLIDLMRSIDPAASQPHLEALAPAVLDCARRELPSGSLPYGAQFTGERILSLFREQTGRDALRSLQEAIVGHLRGMISTSDDLDQIRRALEWLRQSSLPAAAEAVTVFLRTPARSVTKRVERVISDDDDPAVKTVWDPISCSTAELGQPRDLEELAQRDATGPAGTPQSRQAYAQMKSEREHRERVYPDLLNLGEQKDLEAYAKSCLEDPVYDAFHTAPSSTDKERAKLNHLAGFLRRVSENVKAAELLRLILLGDRTKLWESARRAFTLRQVLPAWPAEINWKPLALDLLERTGDPKLDELLISGLEAGAGVQEDLLWKMFARRNPTQLLELSERLLRDVSAIKIPSNSPLWTNASARDLLQETLTAKGGKALALDVILADKPAALRMARDLKARGKARDRQAAYLILCLLDGPEIRTELAQWFAEERDPDVKPLFARHLNPVPL